MLIFYQLKFVSEDITTSEYLRMDKYKTNLFDEGFKNNWKKFLFNEDNFEKELIYNDNAKQLILKTYLITDYLINHTLSSNNNNKLTDTEKNQKEDIENSNNISIIEAKFNNSIEYFKGSERSLSHLSEKN